jgi:DNA ligase
MTLIFRDSYFRCLLGLLVLSLSPGALIAKATQAPALLLAETYQPSIKLSDYWVSEKYDGYRAYWNGTHLLSRQGNIFHLTVNCG